MKENSHEKNTLLIDMENLREKNKALEDGNRTSEEVKENQELEKATLKEKNKKLTVNYKQEMTNAQNKQQDLEKEVGKLKKELNESNAQNKQHDLEKEVSKLKKELNESNANVNALVGQLKIREEEKEELENNIENFLSKKEKGVKDTTNRIQSTRAEIQH